MPEQEYKPLPCDPDHPYILVPLHQYPEFTFPCATLLNMEWPRSRQARLNSLWSCNKHFPVAMVLIQCDGRQVVGYCKISRVHGAPEACFVESVVIHPDMRGRGLGTFLMKKLENYVRSRKISVLYLSTMGQEKFYSKLKYTECEPVSLYSFGLSSRSSDGDDADNRNKKSDAMTSHKVNGKSLSVANMNFSDSDNSECVSDDSMNCNVASSESGKISSSPSAAPPPPPPPLPPSSLPSGMQCKIYMKKELH